jgi:Zn-dependent protease with chaperone function
MTEHLPAEGYRLTAIDPRTYQHPADKAATAALKAIPYLDRIVRKLIELGYEKALRQSYLASSVRLGDEQLPEVWLAHRTAYATLDVEPIPDLYLTQFPLANAMTIGSGAPIVVANSQLIFLLDDAGQRVVFGHEAAHVLSDHVLYRTALVILMMLADAARLPFVAGLPLMAVRAALLEWSRAAELTCDRAAALVVRDPLAVCRTLLVLSAGTAADRLDLDAFMTQSQEYREEPSPLARLTRLGAELGVTHPLPVRRVHELMQWVQSGEYDRIVGGEYIRRGDEPVDARKDAGEAMNHYSQRFRDAFRDAGEQLEAAGTKVSDWLSSSRGGGSAAS